MMLDIAIAAGVFDDPELAAEKERLARARRRADNAAALCAGAMFAVLLFMGFVGWSL